MGEEYADESPFYYFVSHTDQDLIKEVQEGRKRDFAAFVGDVNLPDPFAEDTFNQSKIQWIKRDKGKHEIMLEWHKTLIELRRSVPALRNMNKQEVRVTVLGQAGFVLHRQTIDGQQHLTCLFNLSDDVITYDLAVWVNSWDKLLDSTEKQWQEEGSIRRKSVPAQAKPGQTIHLPPCSITVYAGVLTSDWQ
jgi:maltooligosyltrehalose trehalohydrolase